MPSESKIIKFRTHDGMRIHDIEHTDDYSSALSFKNKIHVGSLGIYHRDLFKKYFIPYEAIQRVYKQVQIITVDDSPPYEHYRIVFEGDHGIIAEVLFGESFMNRTDDDKLAEELLNEIGKRGNILIGYDETQPPQKKSIWHR